MRHFMEDPDNEERLLKVPPRVVEEIKAEERERIRTGVTGLYDHHRNLLCCYCRHDRDHVLAVIDGGESTCTCGSAGDAHLIGCPAGTNPESDAST